MNKPFIENAFIVIENGSKVYTRKLHKTLDEAKRHCVLDYTQYEKESWLDGAEILHVVNDNIISSIDISSCGNGVLYFSNVHLLFKQIPFFE